MLQYERIDFSDGIDVNKTSLSKNVCFAIIGTLKMLELNLKHMFVTNVNVLMTAYELKDIAITNVNVLMTAYELKDIAILNAKRVYFRCILWGISRDEDVNRLDISVLEDEGVL